MMQEKSGKMSRKRSSMGRRAWNILRVAIIWARKGGLLRNGLVFSSNLLGKGLRKLRHTDEGRGALVYRDREFSFDETPIVHVKMHRPSSLRFKMPNIPCIKPTVDFDWEFDCDCDCDRDQDDRVARKSFLKGEEELFEDLEMDCEYDQGIDLKAEQFIANFYEQMKIQRQISFIQKNDHKMPAT